MAVPVSAIAHWRFGHSALYGPKPRSFAVIHYYLDDGGTMNGEFVCMAGYAGTESAWEDFSHRWVDLAVLNKLPNVYLHTSDFLAGQGIYSEMGLCVEQRLSVLKEFAHVIHTHLHLGAVIGLDVKALRLVTKDWEQKLKPNEFCLSRAVRHLTEFGSPLEGAIALLCDSSDSAMHMFGAYKALKDRGELKGMLAMIGFGDDRLIQPLQAADLLACVAVNEYTHAFKNWNLKTPRLTDFISVPSFSKTRYSSELWDQAELERQAPAIRAAALASFERRTGRRP
jgi:hypothetical protein